MTRFLRSSWLRARLADDRGSLPMAMLVSLVGVLLSALLVPVLLDQAQTTTFDSTRASSTGAAGAEGCAGVADAVGAGVGRAAGVATSRRSWLLAL